jgi:hypothetical protein
MKNKFIIFGYFLLGWITTSSIVSAEDQTVTNICANNSMKNISGILNWASCLIYKSIVPLLFALATAGFIWGVMQYYLNPENEEKRKKGKDFIIGGLIALFVMVSVWGIVNIFTGTFDISNTIPQLPGQ